MSFLDLSRNYFYEYGLPLIEEHFPELLNHMAVGLVGQGSECFGFDDIVSYDHDIEPGFCIWLEDDVFEISGEALQKAYSSLPKEYKGIALREESLGAVKRRGVFSVSGFYQGLLGYPGVPDDNMIWYSIPQYAFAEATNGAVFFDNTEVFSAIRNELIHYYPEDVRKAKVANALINMAQAGQYNFERCLKHGEDAAAVYSLHLFVKAALQVVFLLNRQYAPYYKWTFRALKNIPGTNQIGQTLEYILLGSNEERGIVSKLRSIEIVSSLVIEELHIQKLSDLHSNSLELQAYEVRKGIQDRRLSQMNIFE